MRALILAAVLAFAAPVAAQAPTGSSLTLSDAGSAPAGRVIIDGASWSCDGATCTATGGANQPATRACRRVVARLGKVSGFSWKGQTLSADQLAACNA